MPVNRSILMNRINQKLQYDCMSTIVTEALVRSTPLNKRALAGETKNLKKFVRNTLVSMNALESLRTNYENAENPFRKASMYNLLDAIESASYEAANRIANSKAAVSENMQDIIDHAKFTDAELKMFADKANSIPMETLSEIVNKKVVNVLKDEMQAYEKEETLRRDLRDSIRSQKEDMDQRLNPDELEDPDIDEKEPAGDEEEDNVDTPVTAKSKEDAGSNTDADVTASADVDENEEDSSLDSYLDVILAKKDPRNHISFFSKLQDTAMENLKYYKADISHLCYPLMESMLQNTFGIFPKKEYTLNEELNRLSYATENIDATADSSKIAYISSLVTYTLLEVLKTMNIYSPSTTDIKQVVASPVKNAPALGSAVEEIKDKVMENLNQIQASMMKKDQEGLESDLEAVKNLRNAVLTASKNHNSLSAAVMPHIDKAIESLQSRINDLSIKAPAAESHYTSIARSRNISAFDRLHRYSNYPEASKIQIVLNPACEDFVDVNVLNRSGRKIKGDTVFLNRNPGLGTDLEKIVTESLELGTLLEGRCAVSLYNADTCKEKLLTR